MKKWNEKAAHFDTKFFKPMRVRGVYKVYTLGKKKKKKLGLDLNILHQNKFPFPSISNYLLMCVFIWHI